MSTVRRGAWAVAAVGLASLLVWLIPGREAASPSEDTSCHNLRNLFSPGVTRVSERFSVELKATRDDWPELAQLLEEFANSRDWSFRNTSTSEPGVVDSLQISACAPNQPVIWVNERRWTSRPSSLPPERAYVSIRFYGDVSGEVWQPIVAEFVGVLEAHWPEGVMFLDGGGSETARPAFIDGVPTPAQQ